jgi:hypothetical protein
MRWLKPCFAAAAPIAALALASGAQAGAAMFQASFIMHALGNDVTTGAGLPYNTDVFIAMPIGRDCRHTRSYTQNGEPFPYFCGTTTLEEGAIATGSGSLQLGASPPASVVLPQSAFRISVTGYMPHSNPATSYNHTYATFTNAPGIFFAGGGPAAGLGTRIHTGMGQQLGSWFIREGAHGFGGAMGLLGRLGAAERFIATGMVGTYVGTVSWNMVPALGRAQYATVIGATETGEYLYQNPFLITDVFTNLLNGQQSIRVVRGTGTPWTTGSVTVYASTDTALTVLHRAGFDTTTSGGVRNIQLVTPALTHWIRSSHQFHTGHIGILDLRIVPEPGALLLLVVGGGVLVLSGRVSRRN